MSLRAFNIPQDRDFAISAGIEFQIMTVYMWATITHMK
jgi:hypothetical protein